MRFFVFILVLFAPPICRAKTVSLSIEVDGTQRAIEVGHDEDAERAAVTFCRKHKIKDAPDLDSYSDCANLIAVNIHGKLAQHHIEEGALDKAIARYRDILRLRPGDVDTRLQLAFALQKAERPNEAAALYSAILETAPEHTSALLNLGTLYHKGGDMERAIAYYSKIVALEGQWHAQIGLLWPTPQASGTL